MAKSPKEKIASGVTDAINKSKKIRTTPRLARFSKLPGNTKSLKELVNAGRPARDHLQAMARKSEVVFAQITKDKTEEFKHWGMTPGDKPGIFTDDVGVDKRVYARNKAIDVAKKAHSHTTESSRNEVITALRSVAQDLRDCQPLHHSTVAILLRQTMADPQRAVYMQILQNAGPVAITNAIMDAVMGEGNKALGAALVTTIENSKELQKLVPYSRDDIADALVGNEYWEAQESIGIMKYFIEQSEVAVLELEGKGLSTARKLKAGIMKRELEATLGKTFNDDGYEVDAEGEIVKPSVESSSDDYYKNILQESRARDAEVVKEKRRQAAIVRKANEDDVAKIINRTEEEENKLYGGAK